MNDWTIKLKLTNGQRHTAHYFNMTIVEALRAAHSDGGHAKSAKVSPWDGSAPHPDSYRFAGGS